MAKRGRPLIRRNCAGEIMVISDCYWEVKRFPRLQATHKPFIGFWQPPKGWIKQTYRKIMHTQSHITGNDLV